MKPLALHSFVISLLAFVASPLDAHAQSSEQKVQQYNPPPLFSAPPPVQPRPSGPVVVPGRVSDTPPPAIYSPERAMPANKAAAPVYVKPRISRSDEDKPITVEPYIPKFPPLEPVPMEQTPRGRGLIVDRPPPPMEAPLPARKPPVPTPTIAATPQTVPPTTKVAAPAATSAPAAPAPIAAAPAEPVKAAPAKTPIAAPISVIRATTPAAAPVTPPPAPPPALNEAVKAAMPTTPDAIPAQRVTSKGVVTGPKTMPTAPTTQVEREATYVPPANPAPAGALLEQHVTNQVMDNNAAQAALPSIPAGFVPVAMLKPQDSRKSGLTLQFAAGSSALSAEQTLTLAHQIQPALLAHPAARVQIQAYATAAAGGGQNSDRSIALSRALAIRNALIDQGIEARRIDVRALGTDPAGTPSDRVDMVVSGLKQTL